MFTEASYVPPPGFGRNIVPLSQAKMTPLARILHEKEEMCSLFLQILHPIKPMIEIAGLDGITCPLTGHVPPPHLLSSDVCAG